MRKIIIWMISITLVLSLFSMSGMGAINHHGGGTTGEDILESGLNLTGYHWLEIASDDWGAGGASWNLANSSEYFEMVADGTYPVGYWSNNTLESEDDLDDMFAIMAKHPGVPLNAFFVMEMMDGPAMLDNGFTEYVGIPISESGWYENTKYNSSGPNYRGNLNSKWLEGYNKGYWLPQYHGLTHSDVDFILQNCTEGCATMINTVVNHSSSAIRMPGEAFVALDKSEYVNNQLLCQELGESNKSTEQLLPNITRGLEEFEDLFGFPSETTTPPGYRCSNETIDTFKQLGVYGVTTAPGYAWNPADGSLIDWGWEQFDYFDVISISGRPRYLNGQNETKLSAIMTLINTTFADGQAVILEDHRISYCSAIRDVTMPGERESCLQLLDSLITLVYEIYPDAWFLTSPEIHQLNIRGYSQQNWTQEVVVRNALGSTTSITVNLPPGWDANVVTVTNDTGVSEDFTRSDSRTITLDVPHNETFTVHRNIGSSPNYPTYDFFGVQAAIVAAVGVVIILSVVFKGLIGPISKSFGKV